MSEFSTGFGQPILIMAMPRSGSSMVAGLFAAHGVWVGSYWPGDDTNPSGHFENVPIRTKLKELFGPVPYAKEPVSPITGWREWVSEAIRNDGYDGGPWLFKGNALYYPLWHQFNPVWVCVRRPIESVLASGAATEFFSDPAPASVQAQIDALDHIRDELGGVDVHSEKIIAGELDDLEEAMNAAGIDMDEGVVRQFVRPNYWRY